MGIKKHIQVSISMLIFTHGLLGGLPGARIQCKYLADTEVAEASDHSLQQGHFNGKTNVLLLPILICCNPPETFVVLISDRSSRTKYSIMCSWNGTQVIKLQDSPAKYKLSSRLI